MPNVETMSNVDQTDARSEHQFHHYRGNQIPWFVRVMWICFWCFVAYYVTVYLVPSLRIELTNPP